jgi:hypothetical protein
VASAAADHGIVIADASGTVREVHAEQERCADGVAADGRSPCRGTGGW